MTNSLATFHFYRQVDGTYALDSMLMNISVLDQAGAEALFPKAICILHD